MTALVSRLAVALAGLPLVLGFTYLGGWFLFALLAVAAVVALHELYRLARPLRPLVLAGYGATLVGLLGAEIGSGAWLLGGFLVVFPLAFLFAAVSDTRQSTTVTMASTVFGAAWLCFGLGHLILIRDLPTIGKEAALTTLVTLFVADTFAYAGGRLAGRHKMTPVMSPGKTWEGFILGSIAGILTTFFALYSSSYADGWRSLAVGAAIVVAGTIGDLFESLVKRDFGVKDTGGILLGHGGVLDRVDSWLFAAPAAYYVFVALTS
ncbi:MAG TPA: phosphatidate cytidylyltransferase [Gaiellaceae bacterium]